MKKYVYVQPEYVKHFRCDGQKCGAVCCRGWGILVDEATYQRYSRLKPKSKAKKILDNIYFDRSVGSHFVKFDEAQRCSFLAPDNLCSLQKNLGEQYLSNVCSFYPRVTNCLEDFFERSLTFTCPLATELILELKKSMTFEQIELTREQHIAGRFYFKPQLPSELVRRMFDIQYAAISILQSANLSLDERLILLGFYLDRLDEILGGERFNEIETLSTVYSSEKFLRSDAQRLVGSIEFDVSSYLRTMLKLLGVLCNAEPKINAYNQNYLDAISATFGLNISKSNDADNADIGTLTENFLRLELARKDFLERNSLRLEHYLVNEFFMGFYPWKLKGSIAENYGAFVAIYKILELMALSLDVQWRSQHRDAEPPKEYRLATTLSNLAVGIDHSKHFLESVTAYVDDDILTIMRSLL